MCNLHDLKRWLSSSWYVLAPQPLHDPAAWSDVPPIFWPALQVVWGLHALRCPFSFWYVPVPQPLHDPSALADAPSIFSPASHVFWSLHASRCPF